MHADMHTGACFDLHGEVYGEVCAAEMRVDMHTDILSAEPALIGYHFSASKMLQELPGTAGKKNLQKPDLQHSSVGSGSTESGTPHWGEFAL